MPDPHAAAESAVLVVGAGAIGSLYAAKLAARHDVTVVARAAHAEAINRDGLRITGRESFTCRVRAATRVEAIAPRTLVLLTTKVNENRTAAAMLAPFVGPDTTILCVQNGLGGEDIVREALEGRCIVLRAVTRFGAIFLEPGVIDYKVAGGTVIEQSPWSAALAADLTACGLAGRVSDDIRRDVWWKLIVNCVINPITSILGAHVGSIASAGLDPLKRLVVDECLAVARAEGVTFDVDFLPIFAEVFGPSQNIASMRQDLMKGKPTEIDFMNGAVVDRGRRHGIACPVNAALVAIVKAMEARGRFVVR